MVLSTEFVSNAKIEAIPLNRTALGKSFDHAQMRCIYGYPCSKNRTSQQADEVNYIYTKYGLAYAGVTAESQCDYLSFTKDQAKHIALYYQKKSKNEMGENVIPPNPKGMSGGGYWIVPNTFAAKNFYLGGISIEFHQKRSLVFATRIDQVMSFIYGHLLN